MDQQDNSDGTTNRGFKNCEAFCNRLRRNNPQVYQQLVLLIKDFQKGPQSIHHYHSEMKKLFSNQPSVVEDVNKLFYHDARIKTHEPIQQLLSQFKNDPNKLRILLETQDLIQKGQLDQSQQINLFLIQFRDFPEAIKEINSLFKVKKTNKMSIEYWPGYNKDKRVKIEQPQPIEDYQSVQYHYAQHFYINCYALQQNREIKNEIILLDKIRCKVFSVFQKEEHFKEFFKELINVVHLYSECIITPQEFIDLLSQHPFLEGELIEEMKVAIYSRASARRQQTTLFKPLKDTDFKNAEHVTGSYVKMHPGYANIIRNVIPGVLNHSWVSVPFGSEDYSFSIMRKNAFEEQLFKIEDEMHEYDVNINSYRMTIKLLQKIEQGECNETILRKIMQMKCLQYVYKNNAKDQEEVIQLFFKNPSTCSNIIRERLQIKYQELLRSRDIASQSWKVVQKNNFSRSLDHRSFYFKKNEKQYTCIPRFLKEPEERYKIPQTEYLNSLQQLTTIKPLSFGVPLEQNGSIFSLYIPNRQLLNETFEVFRYYLENVLENEFVFKFIKCLCEGYFQSQFVKENYNFNTLKSELVQIEHYLSNSTYIDFNVEGELKNIQKNNSSSEISEQSEYELERLRQLDTPLVQEDQLYPQTQLEQDQAQSNQAMYGTSGMYIFIRYFYTLYQRLEIAQQVSKNFENQSEILKLPIHQQEEIIKQRYKLFKLALLYSIKYKDFRYQDYLSILFGKQAFLFYTIDKLLSDCCKYLASTASDKITDPYLDFLFLQNQDYFKFDSTKNENLQLANLSSALLERDSDNSKVIFKFVLEKDSLHIHYLPTWSAVNDKQQLNRIQTFIKQYTTTFPQNNYRYKVFLNRNLRDNAKDSINQLQWIVNDSMRTIKGQYDYIGINY